MSAEVEARLAKCVQRLDVLIVLVRELLKRESAINAAFKAEVDHQRKELGLE